MRRVCGVIALAVLLTMGVFAQPVPKIYWEHDGVDVSYFACKVDGGAAVSLGLPTPNGTTYSTEITNCPALMVLGTHSLVISACTATAQCADSTPITVVRL